MQRPVWLHIVRGTALSRHRRRSHRQLHSRQILTSCIGFRQEPKQQTFSLVPLSSCLRPSWLSFVCKTHVSWQTWQKFLFQSGLYSSFSVQLAHPASTITKLDVPSPLWWPMRSAFLFLHVVFIHVILMSICPSISHAPVLHWNGLTYYTFFSIWYRIYSGFPSSKHLCAIPTTLHSPYDMSHPAHICLLSMMFVCSTQRVVLYGHVFVSGNSLEGEKFEGVWDSGWLCKLTGRGIKIGVFW